MNIKPEIEADIDKIYSTLAGRVQTKLIGINGIDCSGKTTLANGLVQRLAQEGRQAVLLHVDDFNNRPKQAELYAAYEAGTFGSAELDDYYNNSVDYDLLRSALESELEKNDITIVEGVFLFKPILAPLIDLKVLLKIPEAVGLARYKERKAEVDDQRPASVFTDIWVPAYRRYADDYMAENQADLVLSSP